ncbi:MAG: hypothetical protein QM500_17465 [Methylococcales bacterium]
MRQYEQDKKQRIFNLVKAAFQDRINLVDSFLSAKTEEDNVMAIETAKECRDLIRMDANMSLGIFHTGSHDKLIDDLTPPQLLNRL